MTTAAPRTLLDIGDDMRALDELLFEVGGDVTDPRVDAAIAEWMSELDADLERKADRYAALIVEMELRAKARAEESRRLGDRARIDERQADFLRARLKAVFEERGIRSLETARFRLGVQGNGGKRPLDVHGDVPSEWCRTKVEPDLARIRDALERGEPLAFAVLQERGTRLSIR